MKKATQLLSGTVYTANHQGANKTKCTCGKWFKRIKQHTDMAGEGHSNIHPSQPPTSGETGVEMFNRAISEIKSKAEELLG